MKAKALTTIACFWLLACASHDMLPASIPGSFNAESIVKERQEIIFRDVTQPIAINVLDIEEGRCPTDMMCIWEGYVKVSFEISTLAKTIDLAIPAHQPLNTNFTDTHTFNVDGCTYKLTLKDVAPYPSTKNAAEPKSAVLVLERD